jgi:FtsP/CotA-like multicopper oxidase with cupredoxin domain
MKGFARVFSIIGFFLMASTAQAKTVHYELTATRGEVNLSGNKTVDFAMLLNGGIPAPTLEFTEGDDAEIVVKNQFPDEEVSIHWHGILLPSEMDGVPYVTTPPIFPGKSFTFRFRIRQHGTYWYHSHTNVQEQKGLFGAIVIHPKQEVDKADHEAVVLLSDWSDENPTDILKNLRKDGDYYLGKKGTARSWGGAIAAGSLGTFLSNEWSRMGGMDLSDVGYDAFLINGKRDQQLLVAHPGQKIRLRIINAAASTYFHVALGQTPMRVISADGVDIQPQRAHELLIGMAETYDVLFEVPEHKNFELKATAQDGTGSASAWIGMGERVAAPERPKPDLYAPMEHGGHGGHEGHESHGGHFGHAARTATMSHEAHQHHGHGALPIAADTSPVIETMSVDEIRSKAPTQFSGTAKVHDVKLRLDGDMRRYVWHINGKSIHQDRNIEINQGDIVRFTFENQTMMHHPMHLHGHFFRVLNQYGASSPLKHTVDVPPHMTRTIEFKADEPGEWMLHCHNLFHLKTGMARIVKYSTYTPKPEIAHWQAHDPHLHDHWYYYGMLEAATNHGQAYFRASQTWNQLEARLESKNTTSKSFSFHDASWDFEGDLFYRRWFGAFLNLVGGGTYFGKRGAATVGAGYLFPLLIETNLLVDHRGNFRLDLDKRFQWTRSFFTDASATWRPWQSEDLEVSFDFEVSLMYSPNWAWALGLMWTNDSLGAGAHFQF